MEMFISSVVCYVKESEQSIRLKKCCFQISIINLCYPTYKVIVSKCKIHHTHILAQTPPIKVVGWLKIGKTQAGKHVLINLTPRPKSLADPV